MLELHNVSIDIAGVPVLRDVHLVLPPGGRVALIGRNGAGKTTTLRTVMGLLPPRAGRVVIDGQDATAVPPHHRARLGIGYAPEERRLFGSFSVQENMLLPAQVLRLASAEVARRLDAVFTLLPELKDLAPRRAAGLSGGQGKMVALGRALMVGTRAGLLGGRGQDGGARPRVDGRPGGVAAGRAVPGPPPGAGAALRGSPQAPAP